MDQYELMEHILHFCSLKNKEERLGEIKNPIYMDERIIDILNELADDEKDPSYRQTYLEHLEFFKEYQIKGINTLYYFTSIKEVELSFIKLAFGFDNLVNRKQYLLTVPFLIEERSINLITNYIEREKHLSRNANSRYYRNLLKACRVIGIEEAFLEFTPPEDERYVDAVNVFLRSDSLTDLIRSMAAYKEEISSSQMRNIFHYLQAQYEKQKSKRDRIVAIWDLIFNFQSDKRGIWYWK